MQMHLPKMLPTTFQNKAIFVCFYIHATRTLSINIIHINNINIFAIQMISQWLLIEAFYNIVSIWWISLWAGVMIRQAEVVLIAEVYRCCRRSPPKQSGSGPTFDRVLIWLYVGLWERRFTARSGKEEDKVPRWFISCGTILNSSCK